MGIKKYFPDALSLCVAEVHTKTVEVAILAISSRSVRVLWYFQCYCRRATKRNLTDANYL